MTINNFRSADNRIPVIFSELLLDSCGYEYGKSVTNLLKYSEQFDHTDWAKVGAITVTSDTATALDGTQSADTIEDTSASLFGSFNQNIPSFNVNNIYNVSIYVKKDLTPRATRFVLLRLAFGGSTNEINDFRFDTKTGEFFKAASVAIEAAGVVDLGDYWRIHIAAKSGDALNTYGRLDFFAAAGDNDAWTYTTTAVGSVEAWGAQCTIGSKLRHYVKTEAASATGSCDATDAKANLLKYSEQFDHAAWAKYQGAESQVITADAEIAPDGTLTAERRVTTISSGGNTQLYQPLSTLIDGETYTLSVWVKWLSGTVNTNKHLLNFQRNSAPYTSYAALYLDPYLDGEWHRIKLTGIKGSDASNGRFNLFSLESLTIAVWGAQVVKGSKAGIYYKTEAAAHTGSVGLECYNKYADCEDLPNYNKIIKIHRYYQPVSNWPRGEIGFPAMIGSPKFTPCQIDPKGSLGRRGAVSMKYKDFADDDLFTDPYATNRNYDPESQGTHFGKLKRRDPFYKGRFLRTAEGYIGLPLKEFEYRLYVIESLKFNRDKSVSIEGKDLLKLADSAKATAPESSEGTLSVAMTIGQTTAVLQTGEGTDYDTDPFTGSAISGAILGYALIGDELVSFTGVSGDTLTGLTREIQGTEAATHSVDESVQLCLHFENKNVVDIIHYLLNTGAGISETYLPYDAGLTTPTTVNDEWDDEKQSWLSTNDLTHTVIEPKGIDKLLKQVCEQNLIYMWFDEIVQKIKLRAIAPEIKNETPPTFTDRNSIIADSVSVKDNESGRISQIWVYYDIIDITGKLDSADNYRRLKIQVDTESEGVNAYDERAIKIIYANWLSTANVGLILTLAGRLLSRYSGTPKIVNFKIDSKDKTVWTGSSLNLDTLVFQDKDGSNLLQSAQIVKATDDHDRQIIDLTAESWDYQIARYGFIMADTALDYLSESAENQLGGCFVSQNDGLYTDGSSGHLIA